MTTISNPRSESHSSPDFADEIRSTLDRLDDLDRNTAGYLKTLAFILHRVAMADDEVSNEEIVCMEEILVDHASLSRAEAMLTVEIARHCSQIADCCRRYEASRVFRTDLDEAGRKKIRRFLQSVAEADGQVLRVETAQIRQIATELGLPR